MDALEEAKNIVRDGAAARKCGAHVNSNPYAKDTLQRRLWNEGYQQQEVRDLHEDAAKRLWEKYPPI